MEAGASSGFLVALRPLASATNCSTWNEEESCLRSCLKTEGEHTTSFVIT